jgi:(p)ppGpp synthase/HD superfamily hydrolase
MRFALNAHAGQVRKGSRIPYAAHLLAVAGIVLDYGGDNDEAIAALLHDCIEDCGVSPKRIQKLFGRKVTEIVVACSDSMERDPSHKPPWQIRKESYLEHLKTASGSVLLVSAADKLHNARSILKDYRRHGEDLWTRFNATKSDTFWYYDSLVKIFRARGRQRALVEELARTVTELRKQAWAAPDNEA